MTYYDDEYEAPEFPTKTHELKLELLIPNYTAAELERRVIGQIASTAMESCLREDNGFWGKPLHKKITEKILAELMPIIGDRIGDYVDEQLAKPIPILTDWGEKTGEENTFRELCWTACKEYMEQKVDDYGRTTTRCRESRLQYLIKKTVADVFQKELKAEVDEIVTGIRSGLESKISGEITASVLKLLGEKK